MSADLEELYQDLILDHFKHPRCRGCLDHPNAQVDVVNPLCGDQISISISSTADRVNEIRFSGKGCSISQASASMMSEACQGKTIGEIKELIQKFRGFMRGELSISELESVGGDLIALNGVRKFTARIKCALLSWDAMGQCLEKLKNN